MLEFAFVSRKVYAQSRSSREDYNSEDCAQYGNYGDHEYPYPHEQQSDYAY